MVVEPNKIDLKSYRVRGQGRFPPLFNLLVIGASIGLFAYVNTYFLVQIGRVIDGSVYTIPTDTFECENYFCDQTAYNFLNYYTYYSKCNFVNCRAICSNYTCSNYQNYGINYFYACQPTICPQQPLDQLPIPYTVQTTFILAIVAACTYGLAILIGLIYGIFAAICSTNLSCLERFGLMFTFLWPRFKYFAFRNRINWVGFNFNLKCMVIVDIVINVFYSATFGLYIALASIGLWQNGPEIANFFFVIWAAFTRFSMVS